MQITMTINDYFAPMPNPTWNRPAAPLFQPQPTLPVQADAASFSDEMLLDQMMDAVDFITAALASSFGAPSAQSPCAECLAEAAPAIRPEQTRPAVTPERKTAPDVSMISKTRPVSTNSQAPGVDALDPASFYMTQNQTEFNPEGSINANCGPASLAMAALAFGKNPPGTSKDDPEGLIRSVRKEMTGNEDIHELTGVDDVTRGAEALGMSAAPVGSVDAVNSALDSGQMIIAGGDPSAYSSGSGGHFVLITGRSADGGYVMNDPAYTGKPGVVLTPQQFESFFGGGVAVAG